MYNPYDSQQITHTDVCMKTKFIYLFVNTRHQIKNHEKDKSLNYNNLSRKKHNSQEYTPLIQYQIFRSLFQHKYRIF